MTLSPTQAGTHRPATRAAADFAFFTLRSAHDGVVTLGAAEPVLIHDGPVPSPGARDIVLVRLPEVPDLGLVVAVGLTPIEIGMEQDRLRAPVLSYRLRPHGPPDTTVIRHPLADRYATAIPDSHGPLRPLPIDRTEIGGWEVFRLVARDAPRDLPLVVTAALRSVRPLLASRLSADAVVGWLLDASAETLATIGQALLRLAPPDTLSAVGAAVLEHPGLARRLAEAWPESFWAELALPWMQQWPRRLHRERVEVGPDLDRLATMVSLLQPCLDLVPHLAAATRRQVEPTRGIAIVATARNEGPYLVDWLAHHRALGVEHVFLYSSDDNDDGSDELLFCLAAGGAITHLRNIAGGVSRQIKAYNHAFLCLPETLDYRWIATIDLDEYIVVDPDRFDSFIDFLDLQEARGAEAVSLNWRMYGPDRNVTYTDRPFAERFLHREPVHNRHVKTIVRSNRVWGTLHHAPLWPERMLGLGVDALGAAHYSPGLLGGIGAFRDAVDLGPAWVNHYFTRSLPEVVMKYARSSADAPSSHDLRFNASFVAGFLHQFSRADAIEDRTILAFSDAAARERDVLMRIPGVAAAHTSCVRSTGQSMRRLVHEIPAHAAELPDDVRQAYLRLVAQSTESGVVTDIALSQTVAPERPR